MAEKNYIMQAVVPEAPRTIDEQQLHVYVPQGSTSNFGVFKPDGKQFVITTDGVLRVDASKLIQLATPSAQVVEDGGETSAEVQFTETDHTLLRQFQFIFKNIKGATGATGATGAKGDTGDNALVYSGSYTETTAGDVMDEPIHLDIANFSRTPVKGDTFILVYYTTETEQTTISLFSIYNVYDTYAEAQPVSGTQYVITGPKGEQGIQGETGTPGKDGKDGVSITSVTQTGVQGGTQVTITLSNGQSTSFIVYNGINTNFQVVDTLPTENISTSTIYLIPSTKPEAENVYDEYIYVNGNWEHIGSTSIDLSDYVTKTYFNQNVGDATKNYIAAQLSGKADASALNTKIDKVATTTATKQAYVKNADGTQGMVNIGGTADDDIATKKQVADAISAAEPYYFTYQWGTVLTAEQKAGIQNDPDCYFYATLNGVTYRYRRVAVEGNRYYFTSMHAYESDKVIDVGQVFVEITTGDDRIVSESIYAESLKNKTDVLNAQSTNNQYPTAKATYDADQATLTAANNHTDTAIAGVSSFEETTYSALKAKRDAGTLVKGKWYRITDYTCTTIQEDTQSAGHVFDIIVRADSTNVLNENAYAALHSGDTYFANCKLEVWQLKYNLDNDTEKFAWADSTNGKGVIYYMKDEWNNECPYDFKNIQFKRYKIASSTNHPGLVGAWGIMSGHDYTVDYSGTQFFYTFAYFDDVESPNVMYDATLKGNDDTLPGIEGGVSGVFGNVIAETSAVKFQLLGYSYEMKTALPNTVIYGTQSYTQSSSYSGFYCNVFGSNCIENTLANNCSGNIFANDCSDNTFGDGCSLNIVGNNFINNTFDGGCYGNIFGNNCIGNTIKSGSYGNTFGNGCNGNELQGYGNTFGNDCRQNKFGDNCNYNALGNGCYSNTFGDSCSYNILGNNCISNTFANSCIYNTFSNGCQENTINIQLQNCFLNDGVQYVKFTSSTSVTVQSVTVESSVVGTSFSNLLELYDADIANKTYPITITRESGTNGKYLMKWNVNGACETGKYKATATAASWTPFTDDMQSTSKGYVDTAIANAITTVLNTPV